MTIQYFCKVKGTVESNGESISMDQLKSILKEKSNNLINEGSIMDLDMVCVNESTIAVPYEIYSL